MLIGAMNHPRRDPIQEMEWMHEAGLDFIDLTLEPPAALSSRVPPSEIRAALERFNLRVIGHTPYYLPIASGIPSLREAAMEEMRRCIDCFAAVGATWVNLHPDPHRHFALRDEMTAVNREAIAELLPYAAERNVGLMVENLPRSFNTAEQLAPLLDPLPDLGLHLDIGHANLDVPRNTTPELVAHYGPRIRHVHLHDNKGGSADLHLPLGAGELDFRTALGSLKASGYDGTITLEVFSRDTHYFRHSCDVLRAVWESL